MLSEAGALLREARKRRGWTARDVAARVSVSPTHVSLVERGRASAGPDVLLAWAAALGMDAAEVCCAFRVVPEPVYVSPEQTVLIPTGVHVAIPEGWEWQIRPRSGMSSRGHWTAWGTIDSDYRGEVKVSLVNLGREPHRVHPGDRIAQAKLERAIRAAWHKVDSLDALGTTARGAGGHGSTGR